MAMDRICLIVSSMMTVEAFMMDHLAGLVQQYEVTVIANTEQRKLSMPDGKSIDIIPIAIERNIQPIKDLAALYRLCSVFRRERFSMIHSVTPKAGFLSVLAGFITRVPERVHTFTGQVWITRSGLKRWLFKFVDKILACLATAILVDSFSQRDFLIEQGVVSREKSTVLANGSISGVDKVRFRPDPGNRDLVRRNENIPGEAIIFLYLGRLHRDKGLLDLARAFISVCSTNPSVHLLMVGPDEGGIGPEVSRICSGCLDKIHYVDYTDRPEKYMAAADVLCLPSYREGFGNVVIEAGATGVPAIGSRIYGITDAIEENLTGLLHDPGNVEELADKMRRLVENPELRAEMGKRARQRVERDFDREIVTGALLDFYRQKLSLGSEEKKA